MTNTIALPYNLTVALQETWNRIAPDAGSVSALEAAELTLDRLTGAAAGELSILIQQHGYKKVLTAAARII